MKRFLAFVIALPLLAQPKLTQQDVERMLKELSNWGRWGKDDQLGALNLITPEKRKQALTLVRDGVSISLSHDVEKEKAADVDNPFGHKMAQAPSPWALDQYSVLYHGYAHTHMDAPCHMSHQGKMYNGFAVSSVTEAGCDKMGILPFKQGIMTRGILIDLPWVKGKPYLDPGEAVYPEDLAAWEKKSGVKVRPGDVIFVYTGRWKRRAEKGAWNVGESAAGLHASAAKWIKDRDVAMVGSDGSFDVLPSGVPGFTHPFHALLLIAMGVPILDNCDLEAVSAAARQRNRWEFLLTASPLTVPGGTGSPINPIATF